MPELPEVETVRRGIAPHIVGRTVMRAIVRERRLRRPVPRRLNSLVSGQRIVTVRRRAKYLIVSTDNGHLLIHLGMSGSLRLLTRPTPAQAHDHVDLCLSGDLSLRFRDPRRFGLLLWTRDDAHHHELLCRLGPEPLACDAGYAGAASGTAKVYDDNSSAAAPWPLLGTNHLYQASRGRRIAVHPFLLDGRIVAGLGNIYAGEALFRAGIAPRREAGRISAMRYQHLTRQIRATLTEALTAGGTTLRDFSDAAGEPGYFTVQLRVYGREGQPCVQCRRPLRRVTLAQRSVYHCTRCQR